MMKSDDPFLTLKPLHERIDELLRALAARTPASKLDFAPLVFLFTRRN
jgi:hypothetical protein